MLLATCFVRLTVGSDDFRPHRINPITRLPENLSQVITSVATTPVPNLVQICPLLWFAFSAFTLLVLPSWCWHIWVVPDKIQEGRKMVVCMCMCLFSMVLVVHGKFFWKDEKYIVVIMRDFFSSMKNLFFLFWQKAVFNVYCDYIVTKFICTMAIILLYLFIYTGNEIYPYL